MRKTLFLLSLIAIFLTSCNKDAIDENMSPETKTARDLNSSKPIKSVSFGFEIPDDYWPMPVNEIELTWDNKIVGFESATEIILDAMVQYRDYSVDTLHWEFIPTEYGWERDIMFPCTQSNFVKGYGPFKLPLERFMKNHSGVERIYTFDLKLTELGAPYPTHMTTTKLVVKQQPHPTLIATGGERGITNLMRGSNIADYMYAGWVSQINFTANGEMLSPNASSNTPYPEAEDAIIWSCVSYNNGPFQGDDWIIIDPYDEFNIPGHPDYHLRNKNKWLYDYIVKEGNGPTRLNLDQLKNTTGVSRTAVVLLFNKGFINHMNRRGLLFRQTAN